jgi:two-component system NarL family response regulator
MKLRVLLAEDHPLMRAALGVLLEAAPDIEVVAQVANGDQILDAVGRVDPDVVCMDINMPGLNGIEATRQILARHPKLRVVGLSVHAEAAVVAEMLAAGAAAYVLKSNAASELLPAIRGASASPSA